MGVARSNERRNLVCKTVQSAPRAIENMSADFLSTDQRPGKVAFSSGVERKMFPMHHAPTRMGIEQVLRGAPHRGPGCYSEDILSMFLQPMDARPRSKRGWYFGATSGLSRPRPRKGIKPSPTSYQRIALTPPSDSYKPFGAAQPRLPPESKNSKLPGPATYEHDIPRNRHVQFNEAFGSGRSLSSTVTVKCNKGIPEQCGKCSRVPPGDYYENSSGHTVCPTCFKGMQLSTKGFHNSWKLQRFHKVRDCRLIHKHEFPGKEPKTILKSDKELKKLRYREAYMRLYYS